MNRRLQLFGHPIHAMVSDFPMVLLLAWVVVDAEGMLVPSPMLWSVGKGALIAGLVAAGVAATFGFLDYLTLSHSLPKAMKTANTHMLINLSVVSLAVGVLLFRPSAPPKGVGEWVQLAAMALVALGLMAGGWFGGHLVFHHGVGVDSHPPER